MALDKLIKGIQIAAIICNQFGDTGKGKLSDFFSEWADIIARGTGGNNAGHTVVVNGKKRIFHLIPAGITYDSAGKINILGNGMVLDLEVLCGELDELTKEGLSYNNLMISEDAHVIVPYHVQKDKCKNASQKDGGIGSTGRGIGPCYEDKIARAGIMVRDLFDQDTLAKKLKKAAEKYPDVDIEQVMASLKPFAERIKPYVRDTITEMQKFAAQGKKILLEGAQGLLLSIEFGTYPYVTSSDCSLNGTASGVGISAKAVDLPLGIVKFPFMTRVGAGPFPSELGGKQSEEYCAAGLEHNLEFELKVNGIPYSVSDSGAIKYDRRHPRIIGLMNSLDDFEKGVGIRLAGDEYGATTGRPRRTGWTDAAAARYAVGVNGSLMVLTKVDVLGGAREFGVCIGYNDSAHPSTDFKRDVKFLREAKPIVKHYAGYPDITGETDYSKLPFSLKYAIEDFEKATGGRAVIVSTGAERGHTIIR